MIAVVTCVTIALSVGPCCLKPIRCRRVLVINVRAFIDLRRALSAFHFATPPALLLLP